MSSDSRFWVIVAAGLCVAAGGCGGGSPPPAGNPAAGQGAPVVNRPPPSPNPLPAQAPPAQGQPAAGGRTNGGAQAAADDESEATAPGPDDFEINPDQTVLELAGTFQAPPQPKTEAIALPAGQNSTTLQIVSAENSDTPNLAVNTPPAAASTPTATKNKGATKSGRAGAKEAKEVQESTAAGWRLPVGATAVAGSGIDPETGLPLKIRLEHDAVDMVLIPPGVFLEGVDGRDPQAGPQHSVLLETPYYIDVVEVTVARYDAFREFYRKSEGRRMEPSVNHDGSPEAPAVGIKFLDAKFYAKWAGKELPTEAQWERAARGSQGFDYPWGNGRPIWQRSRRPGQLDPVGTFVGDFSPYGIYDMAGNAREWCLDLYAPDIYQKDVAMGASTVRNPAGPKTIQGPKQQVVRGSKTDWAVWQRAGQLQAEAAPDLGFRCVVNVTGDPKEPEKSTPKGNDKKKKSTAF